jgi:hypothetical protein
MIVISFITCKFHTGLDTIKILNKIEIYFMAKIKSSSRKSSLSSTRKNSSRRAREVEVEEPMDTHEEETADFYPEPSKSKTGLIVALVLILAVAGGVVGVLATKEKPPVGYQMTADEISSIAKIEKLLSMGSINSSTAFSLRSAASKFISTFKDNPDYVKNGKLEKIVQDCDEIIISEGRAARHPRYLVERKKELAAYELDQARNKQLAASAETEQARIDAQKAASDALLAQAQAASDELEERKDDVRWKVLDSDMDPEKYSFQSSLSSYEVFYKNKHHEAWGSGMMDMTRRALDCFKLVSNTGKKFRNRPITHQGRKGKILTFGKTYYEIEIVEFLESKNLHRETLSINQFEPDELYELIKDGGSKKNANELLYDYASLLYFFKEFPAARKYLASVKQDDLDDAAQPELLLAEIKAVEPTYNRREIRTNIDTIQQLISQGKRNKAYRHLNVNVRPRFGDCDEWLEFKDDLDEIEKEAKKLQK